MQKQGIWRPKIHFTPEKGWMNDPNGLVYFMGKYHLFYQYNPYHCCWDSMHWGHAVSEDLLHWEEREIVLYPDQEYDRCKEGGCFSGSVVVRDDKMYIIYTGCIKQDGKPIQVQCLAVSQDGVHFTKALQNPVIATLPKGGGPDFRDPKVVWAKGRYRLICGGTDGRADDRTSRGRLYLYSSDDLYRWEYQGILYEAKEGEGSMFECPDFFPLENKWVISASPMYRADNRQNIYMLGELDFDSCSFRVEKEGVLDAGPHYYAAQTYFGREDQPLSIAWLEGWPWMPWINGLAPTDVEGYRGVQSIPRKLWLDEEGDLCAGFAPDLSKLAAKTLKGKRIVLADENDSFWEQLKNTDQTIHLKFYASYREWKEKKIQIFLTEGKETWICFDVDCEVGSFTADYSRADSNSRMDKKGFSFGTKSGRLEVEMVVDRSICTVFLQHGKNSYTTAFYPTHGQYGIRIRASYAEAVLENVEVGFLK